ncbi:hypothetical protein SAY86_030742 [Trapa natans]|uniref:Protein kinase domain-containing protein n=1 Tax=Trapa natans TaxID=22666 RepID=A0AAN7M3F7_TRANT|nr:hypothetical protein SAY86_030742 [Trapa natans]
MKLKIFLPFWRCFSLEDAVTVDRNKNDGSARRHDFRLFSYREMKAATNNFNSSNKIGEGAFGSVYKGRLGDGTAVAVKVLSVELESLKGEREFLAEITALSNLRHQNLVTLRGCCIEGADRFLVYDYMENICLVHSMLGEEQKRRKFNWKLRRDILMGIARALAYLHEEVRPYIVHRDIKGSNILLDGQFTPKVADFGLSKLFGDNMSHISTRVAGTLGYLAPEYAISGHLTRKSDVYSFGVLLLEIITGRPVIVFEMENGEHHLVQKVLPWKFQRQTVFAYLRTFLSSLYVLMFHCGFLLKVWEAYKEGKLVEMVDPILEDCPKEEVDRVLKVGLLCVQEAARRRPMMSAVVQMFSDEMDLQNVEIWQPGYIVNLMDIHIEDQKSNQSFFSRESNSPIMAV